MKKLLITFCLLFSTASFASYGLENLIYFSNEIIQAKFLWNECPFEKAFGPKKTCNPKLLVEEVHKGDASLVGKVVSIKNFHTFYMNFGQKVDDEVFLFIDSRTPANELTLVETVDHREFWNHCRYIVQDPGTKREVLEYIEQQKKPDYKRPSVGDFFGVGGLGYSYKKYDSVFVVQVLDSDYSGWRKVFKWSFMEGLGFYTVRTKFLVKEVLKGDKSFLNKVLVVDAYYHDDEPLWYLKIFGAGVERFNCTPSPLFEKGEEFVWPFSMNHFKWSKDKSFAETESLWLHCPGEKFSNTNPGFKYRKMIIDEAQTTEW